MRTSCFGVPLASFNLLFCQLPFEKLVPHNSRVSSERRNVACKKRESSVESMELSRRGGSISDGWCWELNILSVKYSLKISLQAVSNGLVVRNHTGTFLYTDQTSNQNFSRSSKLSIVVFIVLSFIVLISAKEGFRSRGETLPQVWRSNTPVVTPDFARSMWFNISFLFFLSISVHKRLKTLRAAYHRRK